MSHATLDSFLGSKKREQAMSTITMQYTPSALTELGERTEYEAWLLEAVYEIVDERLAVSGLDSLIYPPAGGPPTYFAPSVGTVNSADWYPGFLGVGAPLVFVTSFKLLDMLLEWVLEENKKPPTYKFKEKIAEVKKPAIVFPPLIETRAWLRERLIALYERLEPLRGTVIHDRHFKTMGGALNVASSKGRTVGTFVTIAAKDLRNLALVLVSILRSWKAPGQWTCFGRSVFVARSTNLRTCMGRHRSVNCPRDS